MSCVIAETAETDAVKILSLEAYEDKLPGYAKDIGANLADGSIFCEGDMLWFLPGHDLDCAILGTPLLDALMWDVDGHKCGDLEKWSLSPHVKAKMEKQLVVLKVAQLQIEHALAHAVVEEDTY